MSSRLSSEERALEGPYPPRALSFTSASVCQAQEKPLCFNGAFPIAANRNPLIHRLGQGLDEKSHVRLVWGKAVALP